MAVLWPWSDPRDFVKAIILGAVRDGYELLRLWPEDADWYRMVGYGPGREGEYIPQRTPQVQGAPDALADLGRGGSAPRQGLAEGEFELLVGPGSVRGEYTVRWHRSSVEELRIVLPPPTEAVASAAVHELREMDQRRYLASRSQEAEPGAAADPAS